MTASTATLPTAAATTVSASSVASNIDAAVGKNGYNVINQDASASQADNNGIGRKDTTSTTTTKTINGDDRSMMTMIRGGGSDDTTSTTEEATATTTTSTSIASQQQEEFMQKDTVIVVNDEDVIVGSASKKDSHVFSASQPRGVLHRAFSVFCVEQETGRLLLQQRAASKITFPNVWTNTCCSHPLHGMSPSEVDEDYGISNKDDAPGMKRAAVRKLGQELGIPASQIDFEHNMLWVTRLHYWAADCVTHGPAAPWGEHEIDYVLFWVVPNKESITLNPDPDEVQDYKWVNQEELRTMLNDPALLFSPWFRIICNQWLLPVWWKENGDEKVSLDRIQVDRESIHCFDPPPEHLGGAGNAQLMFRGGGRRGTTTTPEADDAAASNSGLDPNAKKTLAAASTEIVGDESKKQGAYGKVVVHQEPTWRQLCRLDEVWHGIMLKYVSPLTSNLEGSQYIRDHYYCNTSAGAAAVDFCVSILVHVSRSFAAVIRQLPEQLLMDVLVFYLVLRALDTIEDDTVAFVKNPSKKLTLLKTFHKTALQSTNGDWSLGGVGQGQERVLLEQFPKCLAVYGALPEPSRRIIADITARMGSGMAEFCHKDLGQGTVDVAQYNRYCHFVAGLVGEGLSRLFAASGLESPTLAAELERSNDMGLFLQKVNIIRDYLEDYVDGRAFWPQSIWTKYVPDDDEETTEPAKAAAGKQKNKKVQKKGKKTTGKSLGYFANQNDDDPAVRQRAVACLNELVTDALEHVPVCLSYLNMLSCFEIFRFCAIPQVMAAATLAELYNNPEVFTGVVKLRKGRTAKLIRESSSSMDAVREVFYDAAVAVLQKKSASSSAEKDPSSERTAAICRVICDLTRVPAIARKRARWMRRSAVGLGVAGAALLLWENHRSAGGATSTATTAAAASMLVGAALTAIWSAYQTYAATAAADNNNGGGESSATNKKLIKAAVATTAAAMAASPFQQKNKLL